MVFFALRPTGTEGAKSFTLEVVVSDGTSKEHKVSTDSGDVEVTCGFYINSITEKLPFPDRSPRPIIAFDTLKKWNRNNRTISDGALKYSIDVEAEKSKAKILDNWEQVLCDEWLDTITRDARKSVKWFNNTIRMYTLELLKRVENNSELLKSLIAKLSKNIKKDR